MESRITKTIPQEGTRREAGESLPEASGSGSPGTLASGCPTVSGGGNVLRIEGRSEEAAGCSDTDNSVFLRPVGSVRRKRLRDVEIDSDDSESVMSSASASKFSTARRGKAPTVGKSIGKGAARDTLTRARLREYEELLDDEEQFCEDLGERLAADRQSRGVVIPEDIGRAGPSKRRPTPRQYTSVLSAEPTEREAREATRTVVPFIADPSDPMTADEVHEVGLKCAYAVKEVSQKSGNLKGTSQGTLNNASLTIRRCLANLASRTSSDEARRTEEANRRLREEVRALRSEVASLKSAVDRVGTEPSPPRQERPATKAGSDQVLLKALMEMRHTMEASNAAINARLDGLEMSRAAPERARPPRAVERGHRGDNFPVLPAPDRVVGRRLASPARSSSALPEVRLTAPMRDQPISSDPPQSGWATAVRGKRKRARGNPAARATAPVPPLNAPISASAPTRLAVPPRSVPQATTGVAPRRKPRRRRKTRLRQPTSSAVVVKLRPEALAMGVTYADAIKKARLAISLPDLGIEGVRSRTAATGARLFEVPGTESGAKADLLASRLEQVLSEVATVVRPEKHADIRVSGLDDDYSTEDVAALIAARAGCPVGALRVGRIRMGPNNAGSTIVRCPLRVAKTLVSPGRVLLGWSFVQVVALEPRPMRCYRCMGVGHTRQRCPSAVDRSELCFRCGLPGHQSKACSKEPKCAVCFAAGKPHQHLMGGRGCSPPAVRGRPDPPATGVETAPSEPAPGEPLVDPPLDVSDMETTEESSRTEGPTADHPNASPMRGTGSEGNRVVEEEDPGEGPSRPTTASPPPSWSRPRAPDGRFAKPTAVKPTPKAGPTGPH